MSDERIVRRVAGDRREGRTDWDRVRRMTEAEVERNAREDPDNPPWTEEELANARLVLPPGGPKVPVSIRLDAEILDYFRGAGPGYQSRINAVLLAYVRSHPGGS